MPTTLPITESGMPVRCRDSGFASECYYNASIAATRAPVHFACQRQSTAAVQAAAVQAALQALQQHWTGV